MKPKSMVYEIYCHLLSCFPFHSVVEILMNKSPKERTQKEIKIGELTLRLDKYRLTLEKKMSSHKVSPI